MSGSSSLDVLVLTDLHYQGVSGPFVATGARRGEWMPHFVERTIERMRQLNINPDLIVLLGDLVNDGNTANAESAWTHLAGLLKRTGIPVLAIGGNHDVDCQTDRTYKLHFRVSGGIRQSRITVLLSSRARAGRAGRRFRRTFFDARR